MAKCGFAGLVRADVIGVALPPCFMEDEDWEYCMAVKRGDICAGWTGEGREKVAGRQGESTCF